MKNKGLLLCFIAACLTVFLLPLVGMPFDRSDQNAGNERTVSWPSIRGTDGTVNPNYLKEAGDYFERHFAFRPALITADALLLEKVFLTSNTASVITGNDGWLYYSSTLPDFLRKDTLSERGMYNLVHNLRLVKDYVEGQGAKLLFMIPPNKNTLYGEYMPYYASLKYRSEGPGHRLRPLFEREDIPYLDLFQLFQSQNEVLYFREDSHWNNKGALLVYHEALERLGKEHETYQGAEVTRVKDHFGDLSAMIYPALQSAEWDYHYAGSGNYTYVSTAASRSGTVSVEDYHIEAACDSARDRLLMYRDSFGNSLIPFFANEYSYSVFSKTIPYKLASDLEAYRPDHVIIERVERSIRDFIVSPPVLPAQELPAEELQFAQGNSYSELRCEDGTVSINCDLCEADPSYVRISGTLPRDQVSLHCRICLKTRWPDGRAAFYRVFYVSDAETDYGFAAYLPLAAFGTLSDARNANLSVCVSR